MKEPKENIKHSKHAKLIKPIGGEIHRLELGFIGAPCGVIQKLCADIAAKLTDYKIGYVDADHHPDEPANEVFSSSYTDKQNFHRFDTDTNNRVINQALLNSCTTVFVNGNHYKTANQILILNEKKKESLERKLDRIKEVKLIIKDEGVTEVFDYLKIHLEDIDEIPVCKISELGKIKTVIQQYIGDSLPPMKGLVFAGGKSQRMGEDKGAIKYHQVDQRTHMAQLLDSVCTETILSIRSNQNIESTYSTQEDLFIGLGPFGGLLTAFRNSPNTAFLTVPIDAPLIDKDMINYLIKHRNPNKIATCFYNPETKFPEPLITIWEPRAYPVLLHWLSQGYACPRKVLINSDIEMLKVDWVEKLKNANTVVEREELLRLLRG